MSETAKPTTTKAKKSTGGAKGGRGAKKGGAPSSRSHRAGLQFPVGRIHSQLRKGRYAERIGAGAPVYLAAVLVRFSIGPKQISYQLIRSI